MSEKSATTCVVLHLRFKLRVPPGAFLADSREAINIIASIEGLIWKVWTENHETGEAGGVYLFENEPALHAYLAAKIERMKAAGIDGLRVKEFDVNEPLTRITRGTKDE